MDSRVRGNDGVGVRVRAEGDIVEATPLWLPVPLTVLYTAPNS